MPSARTPCTTSSTWRASRPRRHPRPDRPVQPDLVIADSVQTISSSTIDGIAAHVAGARGRLDPDPRGEGARPPRPDRRARHEGRHDRRTTTARTPRRRGLPLRRRPADALRFVRALKNGSARRTSRCFDMAGDGIHEVPDPSGLFMSRNGTPVSGTCVTVALEGRRALPVEVQALVVPSSAPQPRRVVNGVDASRVAMLLAVLERRAGLKLSDADVYVSTVGGMKLTEPGADLAIALALRAPPVTRPYPHTLAAWRDQPRGEIRPATGRSRRRARHPAGLHHGARRRRGAPARSAARRVLADAVRPRARAGPRVLTDARSPDGGDQRLQAGTRSGASPAAPGRQPRPTRAARPAGPPAAACIVCGPAMSKNHALERVEVRSEEPSSRGPS